MADFVGATVLLTLAGPSLAKVRGLITHVSEGILTLNKGELTSSQSFEDAHQSYSTMA